VKVTIDKNRPIPSQRAPRGYWNEVAAAMEIGDSVLIPTGSKNWQTALASSLRRLGAGVAQRQENGGIRVWRTK
jgi:hypothetical protein